MKHIGGMDGKTVVITGGNSGIGKETAVALAADGAYVVITARNAGKGEHARREIDERSGRNDCHMVALDLASFASVRTCAQELLDACPRIDVLVLNAGGVLAARELTEDGHERQLQANHLGHFLLTQLLLDRIVASAPARIVVVASGAHKDAKHGLDWDDLERARHKYRGFQVYYETKLMNVLFTRELARRLAGTGVTANSVDPGFVASKFAREGDLSWWGNIGMPLTRPFAKSPAKGARTSVYLASSPEVANVTGTYFVQCAAREPSAHGRDDDAPARLWAISETMVQSAAGDTST
ncbi:MAG TPA: SDR family oxidoreductase [Acidimicrobiia bacterium]|nr:SDR family oxidoreductase [Acidimicrobiia bacterium]